MSDDLRLKRYLSVSQKKLLRRIHQRAISLFASHDLLKLSNVFGSDKGSAHNYIKHYQHHFKSRRREALNILEIGIGGYDNPEHGGQSLRMWKAYFPNSNIFGIDLYNKKPQEESRIRCYQGSQVDETFLRSVVSDIGRVDIIIDDGSHICSHVVKTFEVLFPLLDSNGIYAIEDLQTSYWEDGSWGGSLDRTSLNTSMGFLKSLVDGLNYEEFKDPGYTPSYSDQNIIAMHFYHNLAFIYKGKNNEGSNIVR